MVFKLQKYPFLLSCAQALDTASGTESSEPLHSRMGITDDTPVTQSLGSCCRTTGIYHELSSCLQCLKPNRRVDESQLQGASLPSPCPHHNKIIHMVKRELPNLLLSQCPPQPPLLPKQRGPSLNPSGLCSLALCRTASDTQRVGVGKRARGSPQSLGPWW